MRLTDDQHLTLKRLAAGLARDDADTRVLERHGLCVTGEGRFGSWARITDAGRQYLDRMSGERSRRASPRQVLAAPAPKAAASNFPGRGSRAGGGSCSPRWSFVRCSAQRLYPIAETGVDARTPTREYRTGSGYFFSIAPARSSEQGHSADHVQRAGAAY